MTGDLLNKAEARTMIELQKVNCPRCNFADSDIRYSGKDYLHGLPGEFFASRCRKCGLMFQNPRPQSSDLGKLYPGDYLPHFIAQDDSALVIPSDQREYLAKKLGYVHLWNSTDKTSLRMNPFRRAYRSYASGVDLIPDFVPEGKLLEIGCASGARLLSLRKLGWKNLHGIELVPEAVERARSQGFAVECGQIEDTIDNYPDNHFDTIITSMVVEHLLDPFVIFQKITRKLKPGGQLLFSTIVHDSLDAGMYGGYWVGFDFPRHMVYFRKADLQRILANDYENIRSFRQNAPIDFRRSSSWRTKHGDGTWIDKLIITVADGKFFKLLGFGLALLGLTTRISFKATKTKTSFKSA